MKCLCSSTRRAARAITRLYEEHLSATNLTPPQFHLLTMLAMRPGLSQAELADKLDLDQTTLSRNLRLLMANRWIARAASTEDRRQSIYIVTPAGHRERAAAHPHWQRAQEQIQEALGGKGKKVFAMLELLTKAAAA